MLRSSRCCSSLVHGIHVLLLRAGYSCDIHNVLCNVELYANSGVEEQKVKDITEMGFTAEQARVALDACGMDKQAALDMILSQMT